MTCDYEDIYSRFYNLISDPDFFKYDSDYAYELMGNWLHDAASEPYIRNIFAELSFDDELMQLNFSLNSSIDDESDSYFVGSIFAKYMVIQWMKPKIENSLNLALMIGSDKEKKIQSNYKQNADRLDSLELQLRKYIRDYGYENNSYINGGES